MNENSIWRELLRELDEFMSKKTKLIGNLYKKKHNPLEKETKDEED